MANIKSAQKAIKRNKKNRLKNQSRKTSIKTAIRKVIDSLPEKNFEKTQGLLNEVQAQLARAKNKNVIHSNAAARKMSRLAQRVKKSFASQPAA